MPDCLRAAKHLAEAFVFADELAHWQGEGDPKMHVEDLESELGAFFREMGREPFSGFDHDMTNLKNQAEAGQPQSYFIRRYAEDLQKQILSEGWLDIVDCQCQRKSAV